ncbi:MAG: C1 family peptidase [Muribaculaceae bacterium]|nr:C1 family peptidase [Muribaculaceae bacterium]
MIHNILTELSQYKIRKVLSTFIIVGLSATAFAQTKGIDAGMLGRMKASYSNDAKTRALRNAIAANSIDVLAVNAENKNNFDTEFSHKVPSKGITDQKRSGRCWLFTGLNVLRSQMMKDHDLAELKLSHNYNFFFDQLEKSNLYLQGMIDNASKPLDDKMVEWLLKNPISDGGQFTGVSDNIMKYGVVPAGVMTESYSSDNTSRMSSLIALKLREDGLELRRMVADKKSARSIADRKEQMLSEIYRMLALTLGEPPAEFTWTRKDSNGKVIDTRTYTPMSFYQEYAGNDLKNNYVMLMNDPTREYHKLYEIDFDRHSYDGANWTYVNLPVEEIKEMAIRSIKDSTMMYFSCDVNKFFDRERGYLDPENFDYASLMGTNFGMDKADRIRTFASASSHAMTLMGVDLDDNGKPRKWMVENSWGKGANDGHLIMTDRWFDEYMFRLVVDKKYATEKVLEILNQKPIRLPAWDPMFSQDE